MSNNYIDTLMKNYSLSTESNYTADSSDSIVRNDDKNLFIHLDGGKNDKDINVPTGGFPPITLCEKGKLDESLSEEEKQKREYSSHKTAVSIKDIMEKRRDVTPFISI
jgi:hypothetical protein